MNLITHCLTAMKHINGIRSLIGVGTLIRARAHSVLYLHDTFIVTLHLDAFRRERDITKFDWPFTPYHSSSARFSTQVGSVLHNILLLLQPGHGKITRFRVYRT